MKIAVASGKGGTGKTSVAVALTLSLKGDVTFIDCDVEEPNAHIFINPEITSKRDFYLEVPEIDEKRCNFCGKCKEICRFNAIVSFKRTIMAFKDMCHSCGGCFLVCDQKAISPGKRLVGEILHGNGKGIDFFMGRLRVGEAMSSPLIKELKREALSKKNGFFVLDAPPGTSCPVIKTVRDVDYVILVTEPTPFGLYDLSLAVKTIRELSIPMGVVINKAGLGIDDEIRNWCRKNQLRVLMEIPFSREVASSYSKGQSLVHADEGLRESFLKLVKEISG